MTNFRFFHTADIHLDSPLVGLSNAEGHVAECIRAAPRVAFESLTGRAIEEQIDFMVIAGDLYDGAWRDYKTGLFFAEQMGRLNQAQIPVFLLHGNHDAQSRITKPLPLPNNVHVFGSRKAQTFGIEELKVALHGQSYREVALTDNLVPEYPTPINGAFNIGVLHTALGGMAEHANYAPCSRDELVAKGYDYWALGHVHRGQVLHEKPYIVFPGNLQGRHVRESGPKGACLVSVLEGEVIDVTTVELDSVRWSVLEVDITPAGGVHDVLDLIQGAIVRASEEADGRLLACRLVLIGQSDLHGRLVAEAEKLNANAQSLALGLGEGIAWVERVKIGTGPKAGSAELALRKDALGDLQRMLQEAETDKELLEQLRSDIGEFARRLPHELTEVSEDEVLHSALSRDYPNLVRQVTPYLNARLTAESD